MVTCGTSPTVQYAGAGCAVLFEIFSSLFVVDVRFTSSATSLLLFTCQDREGRWCELLRWEQQGSRGGVSASGCHSCVVRLCPITAWYFPFLVDTCFGAVGLIEDEVRLVCVCWSGCLVCTCSSWRDVGSVRWQAVLYRGRAAHHRQARSSFGAGRVNTTGPRTYDFDFFFILF
ncbi:hypothetical protein VPH35_116679 [Triticum aestivum]